MKQLWKCSKKMIIFILILSTIGLFLLSISNPKLSYRYTNKLYNHNIEYHGGKKSSEFEWTPNMDFVEESLLMKEQPLNDIKKYINPALTQVALLGNSSFFSVGDEIRIRVTISDGYGKLRNKGGDQLRVRILEEELGAFASGYVVDHYNGSYTAVVRALWRGKPKVEITIGCPREIARAWYDTMIKTPGTRIYSAKYRQKVLNKTQKAQQEWLCHPFLRRITNISNNYCNRTKENDGMSLYCARPESARCQDFDGYIVKWVETSTYFTYAENIISERLMAILKVIQIKVDGSIPVFRQDSSLPRCSDFHTSKLWLMPSPVGFFFNKSWNTLHCGRLSNQAIVKCLRDKHFILLGDSTVRQWLKYIRETYSCKLKTNTESYRQCYSDKFNFSVDFSYPSIPGHYTVHEPTIHSIPNMITNFGNQTGSVVVIHHQAHLSCNHPDVFRDRMMKIRQSIQLVLKSNKHARFYFKGPHTFSTNPSLGDYFGFIYRSIALEVFDGLLDKIVYLDSKDMTIATKQTNVHPNITVAKAMVEQFLSYVC